MQNVTKFVTWQNQLFSETEVTKSSQEIQAVQMHLDIVLTELAPDITAIIAAPVNSMYKSAVKTQA